ncbi:hypothetical protein [Deinococcus sp.]|uniref:hypothetical protein n=1 Tax=Deinococcus sp. TaxID=47478 RepID=UPI003C7D0703
MTPVAGFRLALGLTLALLLLLTLLGLYRQRGGRRGPPRAAHHVLYALTCLGTLATGVVAQASGRPWWPFTALLALLLGVSRTRPGRPAHWRLASLIAALYLALTGWLWP